MFGRRSNEQPPLRPTPQAPAAPQPAAEPKSASQPRQQAPAAAAPVPARAQASFEPERKHSEEYYDVKTTVFNALIDTIDFTHLLKLDTSEAGEATRDT